MSQCYINIAIAKTSRDVGVLAVRIKGNKNALTAVSLACLEIRSRNEEVINSTRKFKGLDFREITSLPEIKKVIYIARHFNHRRK